MQRLLSRLLRDAPAPIAAGDVGTWWRAFRDGDPELSAPIDRAVLAGYRADRLGYAFAGAYQAALRVLGPALPAGAVVSFCVTEARGNHPRAIDTRLTPRPGGVAVTGSKRWSTLAPLADLLLVVAAESADDEGRPRLRLVRLPATAPGVTIAAMPAPPFMPEVPHGAVTLEAVEVEAAALVPGDAYRTHVKPFRTVEDVHLHAAVLGYALSVARRYGFAREAVEGLLAAVAAVRALAGLDPAAAETHVALAGALAQHARLLDEPRRRLGRRRRRRARTLGARPGGAGHGGGVGAGAPPRAGVEDAGAGRQPGVARPEGGGDPSAVASAASWRNRPAGDAPPSRKNPG